MKIVTNLPRLLRLDESHMETKGGIEMMNGVLSASSARSTTRVASFAPTMSVLFGCGPITVAQFEKACAKQSRKIGRCGLEILNNPGFQATVVSGKLNFVVVTAAQLGVDQAGANLLQIHTRASNWGLNLCPPDTALQLLLQCDQPGASLRGPEKGVSWNVAMRSIQDSNGNPKCFNIARSDTGKEIFVNAYNGNPLQKWNNGHRFVFQTEEPVLSSGEFS